MNSLRINCIYCTENISDNTNHICNKKYFPPRVFIPAITYNSVNKYTRKLIKEIPTFEFFESCARGEITPEQGAKLMEIQKQSDWWIIRFLKKL